MSTVAPAVAVPVATNNKRVIPVQPTVIYQPVSPPPPLPPQQTNNPSILYIFICICFCIICLACIGSIVRLYYISKYGIDIAPQQSYGYGYRQSPALFNLKL